MVRIQKEKLNANISTNFNKSTEISYWAKKLNMSPFQLQKVFMEQGSITKTIAYCEGRYPQI